MTASQSGPHKPPTGTEDLTGRDRLVANVLFNWGGQIVFIISGFILPRVIDRQLGQELLGVWDFSWSLVGYFQLVQMGIASSVNPYVARYRIARDIQSLNRLVSSAALLMTISGALVFALTIVVSMLLPGLFGAPLGASTKEAQWVVLFLGASMAVETALQAYNGVLTGCHQWKLQNTINSGWYAITIVGMVAAVLMGQSLKILAMLYLIGTVLAYGTRMVCAYRVCKGLEVRPSLVELAALRDVLAFAGKTVIPSVSQLLLNQTTSCLIAMYLGPATLALYSRPRSLVYQVGVLTNRMAVVLIPTASSLQHQKNAAAIQSLLIKGVRYSLYTALPIVLTLVVFGGMIMRLWMGPRYANGLVPAILAIGFLAGIAQQPVWVILVGLNAHGRLGFGQFFASACAAGLNFLVLAFLGWGLAAVAIAVTVPLVVMNIVYVPLVVRRQIGMHPGEYFRTTAIGPMIHILPFAACLLISRLLWRDKPLFGLMVGGGVGVAILSVTYWRHVLPDKVKNWMVHSGRKVLRATGLLAATDAGTKV